MARRQSGGGKLITGIVCFLLGIIVAIAAEFAAIAGCVYVLYNSDLEELVSQVTDKNTEVDEYTGETKYVYINTSELTTVSELIAELQTISEKGTDTLTLNDLSNFPIVDSIVDTIYETLADVLGITKDEVYDIIDIDELKSTPIAELATFLNGCLDNVDIATILAIAGMNAEDDIITLALAYGNEAGTVEVDGETLVIYKEELSYDGSVYTITASGNTLSSVYDSYVYSASDSYTLYYYVVNDTAYVAQRSASEYSRVYDGTSPLVYSQYNASTATYSGAYYYDGDDIVVLSSKKIGDLSDGLASAFDDIYLSDFIAATDENQVFIDALEGVTIGDLLSDDGLDIDDLLSDILVTDLLDTDDEVIAEIFDGMTLGELKDIDIDEILAKVYVPEVMDVTATNGVLAFIGYGITGVEANSGTVDGISYNYTATLHLYTTDIGGNETATTYDAYVVADSSDIITNVYYDDNGVITEYRGTIVSDISAQADRLMDTVEIGDMVTFTSDTQLTRKISESTINGIGEVIDNLTLADAMDGVAVTDSAVILYMTYGISGFELTDTYTDGEGVTYDVYKATYHSCTSDTAAYDDTYVYLLADSNGNIVGMYADTAYSEEISATLVNDVSSRVDGLMADLPIGDIIDTSGSVILNAIAGSTIDSLADDIDSLAIQTVFYNQIYSKVDAADMQVGDATVDSYLKVVSDSITGGTYYYYTAGDTQNNTPASLTETADTTTYLSAGTLYWTDGTSNVIYQVVEYDEEYLYLTSDGKYVEYETQVVEGEIEYIRGHISETNYSTYKTAVGGELYTYGRPQGTWYFMLYSDGVECVYSVDHIEDLTQNASDNLEEATLSELTDADILSLTDDQLEVKVSIAYITDSTMLQKYQDAGAVFLYEGKYYVEMGDLYLADTISIFINVLDVLSGS